MNQIRLLRSRLVIVTIAGSVALLLFVACGNSSDLSNQTGETRGPFPTSEASGVPREVGEYVDITFIVSEGSEATFTVGEKLVRLPLPSDAVMRTTALSGEVRLDGRSSVIQIDLHQLSSNQNFRDRYVREQMFPDHPIATLTLSDVGPIPDGLASGDEVTTRVTGSLEIRDVMIPLEFDIEARDDGDVMFILARTTFTWEQLEIPPPSSVAVASVEDEVRVEILLAVTPEDM